MATAEKRKCSEGSSPNIWDNFINNPLDGRRGSSTGKAKSWGNGPMWSHLKVCSTTALSSSTPLNLEQTFAKNIPLQKHSVKAKAITRAIRTMVAVDLRPHSIVENEGFIQLLRVLEPRYSITSRKVLTKTVVPEIYSELQAKVKQSLSLL